MAFHKNIWSFTEVSKLNYNEILEFMTRWMRGLLTLLRAGLERGNLGVIMTFHKTIGSFIEYFRAKI